MSVGTPIIDYIDGANRKIFLKQGVSDYYPIEDIYHEYRRLRALDTNGIRKFEPFLTAEGNKSKGGGAFTPRYVVLLDGTKIVPYNESLQVNQLGDMITDNADVDPLLYDVSNITVGKTIFIKPSESETIQLNSESIVFSSFQGAVWVNVNSIYDTIGSSTEPNGNTERPVNNIQLAVDIAEERGFKNIMIIGDITLGAGDTLRKYTIVGENPTNTKITILDAAIVEDCTIFNAEITGILDGGATLRECLVDGLSYVNGFMVDCALTQTPVVLGGNAQASFLRCYSIVAGALTPIIDVGGTGQSLVVRYFSGGLRIINRTGIDPMSIDFESGHFIADASCTNGEISARGSFKLTDNTTETCTIDTAGRTMMQSDVEVIANMTTAYLQRSVYVNTELIVDGDGSQASPFNNVNSAKDFAEANGINNIYVAGDIVVPSNLKGMNVQGIGLARIDFNGQDIKNSRFTQCSLSGNYTGGIIAIECELENDLHLAGHFMECEILGNVIANPAVEILMYNCMSGNHGVENTLSMNAGAGTNVIINGYSGELKITDADSVTDMLEVNMSQGKLTFDASCVAGELKARGGCTFVNNSTSTVIDDTYDKLSITQAVLHTEAECP